MTTSNYACAITRAHEQLLDDLTGDTRKALDLAQAANDDLNCDAIHAPTWMAGHLVFIAESSKVSDYWTVWDWDGVRAQWIDEFDDFHTAATQIDDLHDELSEWMGALVEETIEMSAARGRAR